MSEFDDSINEFLAPSITNQFGDTGALLIRLHGDSEFRKLTAIVGTHERNVTQDQDTGELKAKETVLVTVTTQEAELNGFNKVNRGMTFMLDGVNGLWELDFDLTKHGKSFIDIALMRKPLVRKNEARRAGI